MESKKQKSGMYGEMPTVKIGKFTIAQMTDAEGCEYVWIQDNSEDGDGGQFDGRLIESDFKELYNKHF